MTEAAENTEEISNPIKSDKTPIGLEQAPIGTNRHRAFSRRIAPFLIDGATLRAWMRGADLKAPKWKNSVVYFAKPPAWLPARLRLPTTVSDVSVIRSRFRADQAVRAPEEARPVWNGPNVKPVHSLTQWEMLFDEELQDGSLSIASLERVYSAEELAVSSRWAAGLFSKYKSDALALHGTDTRSRAERHQYDFWPFFTEPVGAKKVRPLTEQEIEFGFAAMTTLANQISGTKNKEVSKIVGAKTASARAYQAAEPVLRLYRFGDRDDRRVPHLREARFVYQQVSYELLLRDYGKLIGQLSKGRRKRGPSRLAVVPFMLAPGVSSTDAWLKFDRDASDLRKLLNEETDLIEEKYGRFCKDLVKPPRKGESAGYTGVIGRKSAPPTDRVFSPAERAAEADKYRAEAQRCRGRLWLHIAYLLITEYIARGGRILTACAAYYGMAPFRADRRSANRILEESGFTGSRPVELFEEPKAQRPDPNKEYRFDTGLKYGLAEAIQAIEDDGDPISDTRKKDETPFFDE